MVSDSHISILKPMPSNGFFWLKLDMLLRRNYYCCILYLYCSSTVPVDGTA